MRSILRSEKEEEVNLEEQQQNVDEEGNDGDQIEIQDDEMMTGQAVAEQEEDS